MALVLVLATACGDDGGGPPVGPAAPVSERTTITELPPPTTTVVASTTTAEPEAPTYVFPLVPADVTDYSDAHHDYPAVDVFAPEGTEFVAVTDGVVDVVTRVDTWDPATDDPAVRGGLSVAIVGADGVRYYGSHLSSVAPGIQAGLRVEAGQRLGASGRSGNARNTDPHLHFGISRPTTPEDWQVRRGELNPFPYLEAWRRGEDLVPSLG